MHGASKKIQVGRHTSPSWALLFILTVTSCSTAINSVYIARITIF